MHRPYFLPNRNNSLRYTAFTPVVEDIKMSITYLQLLQERSREQTEQVRTAVAADVLSALLANAKEGGTFRYLVYDRLKFSPEAYRALYLAGGATIVDTYAVPQTGSDEAEPRQLSDLRLLAEAAELTPHPSLKNLAGEPLSWPSEERTVLFCALNYALDLVEANKQLLEANRRLAERCEQLEQHPAPGHPPAAAQ
jgi:hypothetical protein